MITDPTVFDEDYLPPRLLHRRSAETTLSRAFQPALAGSGAETVLISGPSGVGKTHLARYVLEQLHDHAVVDHAHIHSVGKSTADILRAALRASRAAVDPAPDTPAIELRAQLREAIDHPYILVLDEADGLAETDALEALLRVDKLSLVAICHDRERWLARFGSTVQQAIDRRVRLDRYGTAELADILHSRADLGLDDHVVGRAEFEWIADETAGIARYGIKSLEAAAEIATERGHSRIRDEDVEDSFERAREAIRRANLRSLPYHHQVIYAIIHAAGEIRSGELHRQYERLEDALYRGHSRTPLVQRTRRDKLDKLYAYDLIAYEGETNDRVYTVRDVSVEPLIDLDLASV